ncbi:MAG: SufD family Fe-S cluster assembly protein [Lachnospiraceae bacterium]|nr:SufD family Fe-S cluster assembly protein [Lachnospiraceae bacterium]
MELNAIQKSLLKEVAELDALPVGAYNIRSNGQSAARNTTEEIDIVTKTDKPGIDIIIKPGTKKKSVHIPVIISESGLKENVYNDFFIGEDCDVTIIAGCGISNCGGEDSEHDGIHSFYVGKNSKVRYIERHYGEGTGRGKRLMNPTTVVELAEGAFMDMQTSQIGGIDDTLRVTNAVLGENSMLTIHDKILTEGVQHAKAEMNVEMNGDGSNCDIISRGVAKENSYQEVVIGIAGNAACNGHAECDSIIMDKGVILATPQLKATNVEASLIHEAAIGKIAGEQLTKLMTMGLTEKEAEEMIIQGFLR